MTDYNKYVLAVNKIFEIITTMKTKLNDSANTEFIANIEEYKQIVVNAASSFSNVKDSSTNMTEQESMNTINNVEGE